MVRNDWLNYQKKRQGKFLKVLFGYFAQHHFRIYAQMNRHYNI